MNTREKFARFWALRWRILAGCAVLAGAGYLLFGIAVGPKVEVAKVVRREVVQSVVASGRVVTPYRVDIGSQVVGTVAQVPVAEGQTVTAGQTLVALEASEARAGVKQAQVDSARKLMETAQPTGSDSAMALRALDQARATLQEAQAKLAYTVIRAPSARSTSSSACPTSHLRQDMTVSVDIEVERHPDALALPVEAVHDATGPSPWVLKVKNGRANAQPVQLGLRGEGAVEIREGLEAGDLVVPAG